MLENQLAERRPRGRPQVRCDDDTRHLIVEAAAQAFQANGYAATNMGAVAQGVIEDRTDQQALPVLVVLQQAVQGKVVAVAGAGGVEMRRRPQTDAAGLGGGRRQRAHRAAGGGEQGQVGAAGGAQKARPGAAIIFPCRACAKHAALRQKRRQHGLSELLPI